MTTTRKTRERTGALILIDRWRGEIRTAVREMQAGRHEEALVVLFTLLKAMDNLEKKTARSARGGTQ
jgi:hypothetical protein